MKQIKEVDSTFNTVFKELSQYESERIFKIKAKELQLMYENTIGMMEGYKLKLRKSNRASAKYLFKLLTNSIELLNNYRISVDAEYIKHRLKLPRYKRVPKDFMKNFR